MYEIGTSQPSPAAPKRGAPFTTSIAGGKPPRAGGRSSGTETVAALADDAARKVSQSATRHSTRFVEGRFELMSELLLLFIHCRNPSTMSRCGRAHIASL